jgi:hypothetical protein
MGRNGRQYEQEGEAMDDGEQERKSCSGSALDNGLMELYGTSSQR